MRDYEKGYWLNKDSRLFLSRGYLPEGQTAEERIREIAERAQEILQEEGFADKLEDYILRGWISMSSPVWSNFSKEKTLPISCNGCLYLDTIEDILMKTAEIGMMSKLGAGTSAYIGLLRPRGSPISVGGVSSGPVHFAEMIESTVNTISQSKVRRGSCAISINIDHPDIEEFLFCREEGASIQHLSLGVCITDEWMESMIEGDKYKRKIWLKIMKKRYETGYPYLFFTDTANRNAPQVYKDKNKMVYSSNLCQEIFLAMSEDESFVCNLSSLNVLHYDEWKDTDLVAVVTRFLDAIMTEYIEKTKDIPLMKNAYNFAIRQRALGIGTLGWHSYLQSKMISFESEEALKLNDEIHENIKIKATEESKRLATIYGEPELLKGYGLRNVTVMAIAPTTSSSFILGQISPSIEPLTSNYFVKDLAKGKFTYKNPYLKELLKSKRQDTKEIWNSILMKDGSVQHLDFLNEEEKNVFKTFGEISQSVIINQAASRQKFIDQGQSLNLMIHPSTPIKEVNALIIDGWQKGIKSFYYQRSTSPAQEYIRELNTCVACAI